MKEKVRSIKSICGKYTLVYTDFVHNGDVIDNDYGVIYPNNVHVKSKDGNYYSPPHAITGYSAYAEGMDSRKFFTMRFADLKKGVRIIPYDGNTIIKSYTAIFRVQKYK